MNTSTRKQSPSDTTTSESGFEALRRANLAFEAVEQGRDIPSEALVSSKNGERQQVAPALATGPASQTGMVYSRPGRPPPPATGVALGRGVQAAQAMAGVRVSPPASAFERLRLGQQKLGRGTGRQASPAEGDQTTAPAPATQALDRAALREIERQAGLKHTLALLETVATYYKSGPDELQAERARLSAMDPDELSSATKAYEFASHQVNVMMDPAYAQKLARESNHQLKSFYDKHGTTEAQLEAEAPEQPQQPLTKPRRRR